MRAAVLLLMLVGAWPGLAASTDELDVETRVQLQRTLQVYVDGKTEEGIYPFFDPESGEIQRLTLTSLHPVIFRKEGYYMLCADFVDESGSKVVVDYIVRRKGEAYDVEQEVKGRRSFLTTIFEKIY